MSSEVAKRRAISSMGSPKRNKNKSGGIGKSVGGILGTIVGAVAGSPGMGNQIGGGLGGVVDGGIDGDEQKMKDETTSLITGGLISAIASGGGDDTDDTGESADEPTQDTPDIASEQQSRMLLRDIRRMRRGNA